MRLAILMLALTACAPDAPPAGEPAQEEERGEALGVPPGMITRARREAQGLVRLRGRLREEALARHRTNPIVYADLRRDPDAHVDEEASFEGQLALSRPAGDRLWIVALKTRRDGERWTDPLFVLSVTEPDREGAIVRIDGWVVGARTIGRNTLPLILAYAISETAGG
jgi:hypothetical protein